ncbi:Pentapeptide repeat-containing protein, partial [Nonomuraea maritima]
TFTGRAWFDRTTFTGSAEFHGATFTGHAVFLEATFTRHASFDKATGLERAQLAHVRVAPSMSAQRLWPPNWQIEAGADGWATLRLAAPGGDAEAETAQEQEPEGLT